MEQATQTTIVGNVDRLERTEISGWVTDTSHPDEPLIVLALSGGEVVAACVANRPRPDLSSIMSHVNKGFIIDLTAFNSSDDFLELMVLSSSQLDVAAARPFARPRILSSLARSQERWRGDESAPDLTWGVMLSGDEFFAEVARTVSLEKPLGRVVEIGPGYGRLLQHLLEHKCKFASYLGLDLSQARVTALHHKFGAHNIAFKVADVMAHAYAEFDTLICSSTFEHLYPDCASALQSIGRGLSRHGHAFIDFPRAADDQSFKSAAFSPKSGEFVRMYSRDELAEFFGKANMRIVRLTHFEMRPLDGSSPIPRFMVAAVRA